MKRHLLILMLSVFVLSVSCKEKKSEETSDTTTEQVAEVKYQCPMDCEDGKTYDEAGSCPVCKMDLKPVSDMAKSTCSVHQDGKCSCEGEQCACDNCPEHSKKGCAMHDGGECSCEGDQCKCENCETHNKVASCKMAEGEDCSCEDDQCQCPNCETHAA